MAQFLVVRPHSRFMHKSGSKSLQTIYRASWLVASLVVIVGACFHTHRDARHWLLSGFFALSGSFILLGAWQGFFTHSVSLRGGRDYTRKNTPLTYWLSITSGFVFAVICFILAALS